MSIISRHDIIEQLKTITLPDTQEDIVTAGLAHSVVVNETHVGFSIECLSEADAKDKEPLRKQCEALIASLPGVEKVTIVLTAHHTEKPAPDTVAPQKLRSVKKVIAVGAGKGGVGKSTVTVLLAHALTKRGLRVGIADADIYGPSIPIMLGMQDTDKPDINENNKMVPLSNHQIDANSIGFLVDSSQATIWRGPMATKALYQLIFGTSWNNLDVLLIDLPPGTGDVQLSLAKQVPLDGAILVSTPQEIALADVRKAANMFDKTDVPILGIVENMCYFLDPATQQKHYLFGEGKVPVFAEEEDITFFGDLPLYPQIRHELDEGLVPSDAFLELPALQAMCDTITTE
jgi:ATP-binding protein involved in chromosome partitioning